MIFLRLLRATAIRLSPGWAARVGRALGLFGYHVVRYRRGLIETQMSRALHLSSTDGELKRLVRENFIHYGLLAIEFLRIRLLRTEEAGPPVRLEGEHHLREAMALGKGVLILSGHLGNYDLSAVALALNDFPIRIVSKPLKIKAIERFWMEERSVFGLEISLNRGSIRAILEALKAGKGIVFVLDQHSSTESVWVDFFGRSASTLPGLAVLAQRTGAPVIPVFTHREPDGSHLISIQPAVPFEEKGARQEAVEHNTQRYTKVIEAAIRRHPEQWTWIHERWKKPQLDLPRRKGQTSKGVNTADR